MKKKSLKQLIIQIALTILVVVNLSPLVIVLSSSFRTPKNTTNPLSLFQEFSLESYKIAMDKMKFGSAFFNSIILTAVSVVLIVFIASAAAYPIGRISNKFSKFLYLFFLSGLIVPGQMVIIPIAQMFTTLNIPTSRFTPIIMFVTCSLPFTVFLYTGFLRSVPIEIEEAAYLDGAGYLRRYFSVVFPLIKPATISAIITQGVWIWNDYFYPLIFISKKNQYTLPLTMLSFLGDKENPTQWNILFASCILCAIPLVAAFTFLQKHFVGGLTTGGVKG